ncbi:MAG: aldehyde dehydrogenase family protein [Cryomorphaceae bacterium]|nr:aldehyde dehydrogenase family protein [Cryomorphaceae bacterium]
MADRYGITGQSYVGENLKRGSDRIFHSFNSASASNTPWEFFEANTDLVDEACALAKEAFKSFQSTTFNARAAFLRAIADEMEGLGDDLLQVFCLESSLTMARARVERARTLHQLRSFAGWIETGNHCEAIIETSQGGMRPDIRKMMVPTGPIVVFGASNFPLAYSTAGGDTASAMAAGCPVIVKSHPMHAATGELVASSIIRAARATGMPNGVFSNLTASSYEVGEALVLHDAIAGVGFTGSLRGGRALYDLAARRPRPIPVFAEMGSTNPVVFFDGALKDEAIRSEWVVKMTESTSAGVGQFCTNPGLIIAVHSEALTAFVQALSERLNGVQAGDMLHPDIYHKFNQGATDFVYQPGVVELTSGVKTNGFAASSRILEVSGSDFQNNPNLHHEVFGPLSLVVRCADVEQLEAVVASLGGQLTGSLIGVENDFISHSRTIELLKSRVGRLIFNGVPTGVEVNAAMQHGGPYPATTDQRYTAVGVMSIKRWLRPIAFQNCPDDLLPEVLRNENPKGVMRLVNGEFSSRHIE